MLPKSSKWGRLPTVNLREVLNGIFYILKNGCMWKNLPHDLPPSVVYFYKQRWTKMGVISTISKNR